MISELVRKRPDPAVVARVRAVRSFELVTSAVCVTELRFGTARHPNGRALWERLEQEVLARLEILPFDEKAGIAAGDVLATLQARGQEIDVEDVLIGATALARGLTVVTRNVRHFDRIEGLKVESWWSESAK